MKIYKKKIVLLNSSLAGGGAEGVCASIANSFAKKGWLVDLVLLNLNNEVYLNRLSSNVNLVLLNVDRARYSFLPLLKYLNKNKPKTILVFNYELSIILVILRFIFRIKINIIARNINTFSIKLLELKKDNLWQKFIVRTFLKYFYNKVDHVINQCKGMKEDLVAIEPKFNNNTSVIYNPVADYISNYANSNDLKQIKKENYLLYVGSLEKQKAIHYAIEGFAGVAYKFPNLRLKILGKGSLEKDLKKKAKDLGVSKLVDFEGFQKNIIFYYLHAKATILTSLYEGFPNTLLESITLGTPVVSFDCPSGPNEIIEQGINGYLVEFMNIEDLKNKLFKVVSQKFSLEEVGLTAKKYQQKEIIEDYEKLINNFI
jgi:glycosyltransferase involved in cell wall biosynthesis